MNLRTNRKAWAMLAFAGLLVALGIAYSQEQGKTSYTKLDITERFVSIMGRMKAAKPAIEKRQANLLNERYDLSDRAAAGVTMERGKPLQEGTRIKLPQAMTWEKLASMSPAEIREKNLFPKGFYPLPHPNHPEGGMLFPHFEIDEIKKQDGRDLTRFDLDFDLPDHFLPAFPPSMYLTTRPDLGDVSKGKLVTLNNYYELFNGVLNRSSWKGCVCW